LDEHGVRKKIGLPHGADLEALADRVAGRAPSPATSSSTSDGVKQQSSSKQ
jgi:hypothetical protein